MKHFNREKKVPMQRKLRTVSVKITPTKSSRIYAGALILVIGNVIGYTGILYILRVPILQQISYTDVGYSFTAFESIIGILSPVIIGLGIAGFNIATLIVFAGGWGISGIIVGMIFKNREKEGVLEAIKLATKGVILIFVAVPIVVQIVLVESMNFLLFEIILLNAVIITIIAVPLSIVAYIGTLIGGKLV